MNEGVQKCKQGNPKWVFYSPLLRRVKADYIYSHYGSDISWVEGVTRKNGLFFVLGNAGEWIRGSGSDISKFKEN